MGEVTRGESRAQDRRGMIGGGRGKCRRVGENGDDTRRAHVHTLRGVIPVASVIRSAWIIATSD